MLGHRGAAGEVIDNYTTGGAHVRPTPVELQLEYRIDVYAQDRGQKATLLDLIVVDLLSPLVVGDVAYELVPFRPSQQEAADLIPPGRTPLFARVVVPVETGVRVPHDRALPFLVVGHIDDRAETEALAL